jgi:hypothetical protein
MQNKSDSTDLAMILPESSMGKCSSLAYFLASLLLGGITLRQT